MSSSSKQMPLIDRRRWEPGDFERRHVSENCCLLVNTMLLTACCISNACRWTCRAVHFRVGHLVRQQTQVPRGNRLSNAAKEVDLDFRRPNADFISKRSVWLFERYIAQLRSHKSEAMERWTSRARSQPRERLFPRRAAASFWATIHMWRQAQWDMGAHVQRRRPQPASDDAVLVQGPCVVCRRALSRCFKQSNGSVHCRTIVKPLRMTGWVIRMGGRRGSLKKSSLAQGSCSRVLKASRTLCEQLYLLLRCY